MVRVRGAVARKSLGQCWLVVWTAQEGGRLVMIQDYVAHVTMALGIVRGDRSVCRDHFELHASGSGVYSTNPGTSF